MSVTLNICSLQPTAADDDDDDDDDDERLSPEVVCLPYGRTVSRARARETES